MYASCPADAPAVELKAAKESTARIRSFFHLGQFYIPLFVRADAWEVDKALPEDQMDHLLAEGPERCQIQSFFSASREICH